MPQTSLAPESQRELLKPYVGQRFHHCYGIITRPDQLRLKYQNIIVSIYTPVGQLDHIAIEFSDSQPDYGYRFQPVHFQGKVYQYQHRQADGQMVTAYSLKNINHIYPIYDLGTNALSNYQRRQARDLGINYQQLQQLPNDGERERYIAKIEHEQRIKKGLQHD